METIGTVKRGRPRKERPAQPKRKRGRPRTLLLLAALSIEDAALLLGSGAVQLADAGELAAALQTDKIAHHCFSLDCKICAAADRAARAAQDRRAKEAGCRCGKKDGCDCDKWDEIYRAKFEDPTYYSPKSRQPQSSLREI